MNIKVKDSEGNYNIWNMYDETEKTYKIEHGLYITEIYKNKCVDRSTEEIRNTTFNNGNVAFAAFITINTE